MFVVTVDAMTLEDERAAKRSLMGTYTEPRYDDFSSVASCIGGFFEPPRPHGMSVFPVSFVTLYGTETYDLVVELVSLLAKTCDDIIHVAVLLDGDENDALEELFANDLKIDVSIEDLKERREMISGVRRAAHDAIFSAKRIVVRPCNVSCVRDEVAAAYQHCTRFK